MLSAIGSHIAATKQGISFFAAQIDNPVEYLSENFIILLIVFMRKPCCPKLLTVVTEVATQMTDSSEFLRFTRIGIEKSVFFLQLYFFGIKIHLFLFTSFSSGQYRPSAS